MAEDEEIEDVNAGDETNADEADLDELPSKKLSGKKLVLFIVLPLFLIIGGGGGLYFSGLLDGLLGIEKEAVSEEGDVQSEEDMGSGVFYEVPDMIVNLNTDGRKQRFLKLSISLELPADEDVAALESALPRVIDHFQTYLRELRLEDLKGSAGVYRIRQELLERVRTAIYPVEVRDVLFREILVQ